MLTEQKARKLVLVGAVIAAAFALPGVSIAVLAWKAWGPEVSIDWKRNSIAVGYSADFSDRISATFVPEAKPLPDDGLPLLQISEPPAAEPSRSSKR
jgi:hypothetical protein